MIVKESCLICVSDFSEMIPVLLLLPYRITHNKFATDPDFVSGDDTENTNCEKRPLYTVIGKDQNENIFPIAWAFMPSKSFWAYLWFFSMAMPLLHPGDAIQRVQLILTDADPQETAAIEKLVGGNLKPSKADERLFRLAWHRWCAWHRINRNFTEGKEYKSMLTKIKNSCILSKLEIDVLERWLYFFIKEYETPEEAKFCMALLTSYLNDDNQSSHIGKVDETDRKIILEFITKHFDGRSHKLFECEFDDDCQTLGNSTTGASEGYHSGIKRAEIGPRPCDPLHITAKKLIKMAKSKAVDKSQKASHDATAAFGKEKDRQDTVQELSDFVNDRISDHYNDCQEKLVQYRVSEDEFFVKFEYDRNADDIAGIDADEYGLDTIFSDISHDEDDDEPLSEEDGKKLLKALRDKLHGRGKMPAVEYKRMRTECVKYIIPRLERTRVVKLVRLADGSWALVCSCPVFKKRGHACMHMYKVLKRAPTSKDAQIRWQNHYVEDYGRNDELTHAYMHLRSLNLPGVQLSDEEVARIKSSMEVGSGEKDVEYFERSHKKIRLRGANTFWTANAERLRDVLGGAVEQCVPVQDMPSVSGSIETTATLPPSTTATASTRILLPSTTYGPTQMVECTSDYVVPSQTKRSEYHANTVDDANTGDEQTPCPGQTLLDKFLPRYDLLCKTAEAADGDKGVQVMEKYFKNCQLRFLNFIHREGVRDDNDLVQPISKAKKGKARARGSLYLRFKPPLERICKMAEETGIMGVAVVSEEFQCCQAELTALSSHKDKLTNAQKDQRLGKATSPPQKKPKR